MMPFALGYHTSAQDEKTLSGKREVWSFLEKVMFEMDIKRLKVPEIKAN